MPPQRTQPATRRVNHAAVGSIDVLEARFHLPAPEMLVSNGNSALPATTSIGATRLPFSYVGWAFLPAPAIGIRDAAKAQRLVEIGALPAEAHVRPVACQLLLHLPVCDMLQAGDLHACAILDQRG